MKDLQANVSAILSRKVRHHVHSGIAAMESHDDINTNLEMRLVEMNVEKMRRLEKR